MSVADVVAQTRVEWDAVRAKTLQELAALIASLLPPVGRLFGKRVIEQPIGCRRATTDC